MTTETTTVEEIPKTEFIISSDSPGRVRWRETVRKAKIKDGSYSMKTQGSNLYRDKPSLETHSIYR